MTGPGLTAFLAGVAPFDSLDDAELAAVVSAARVDDRAAGEVVTVGAVPSASSVFVVVDGEVDVWDDVEHSVGPADHRLRTGGVFSTAAVLAGPSLGPHAVAVTAARVATIPATLVAPAFAARRGAAFLAEHVSSAQRRPVAGPRYTSVDDLLVRPPLVVDPATPAGEAAARMTAAGVGYAAVPIVGGRHALVTDALLRQRLLVDGLPPSTPAVELVTGPAPTAVLGDAAAEALILLLDADAEVLLVTDRGGQVRGAVTARDFVVSPATAGVALHEQLRRAATVGDLAARATGVPALLGDLVARGMAAEKVVAVHSAVIDTVVRRAVTLVFAAHPELPVDAFTWLALGSNGRREAVPSSDVESAVVFADGLDDRQTTAYRAAFAEVDDVLTACGFGVDTHGASASTAAFARTGAAWRAAVDGWRAAPEAPHHAAMLSLLIDSRPVFGDPGRCAVAELVADLRSDDHAMRVLLVETLGHRSRVRSMRDVFGRRVESFDVKRNAVTPVVNLARWTAVAVGSTESSTTHRIRAAAGSLLSTRDQADSLEEAFAVLQALRLRYQLAQVRRGHRASDVLTLAEVSPIDRSMLAQAVREIADAQRRTRELAGTAPPALWQAGVTPGR